MNNEGRGAYYNLKELKLRKRESLSEKFSRIEIEAGNEKNNFIFEAINTEDVQMENIRCEADQLNEKVFQENLIIYRENDQE